MHLRSLVAWLILAPRDGMRRSLEKKPPGLSVHLWNSSTQKRWRKFLGQENDIIVGFEYRSKATVESVKLSGG